MPSSRGARMGPSRVFATPGSWTDTTSHRVGVQTLGNRPEVSRTRLSTWSRAARLTTVLAIEIGLNTRARATDVTLASLRPVRTGRARRGGGAARGVRA